MNNEPVAECCDDGEGGVYYKTLANKAPIGKLYTHPADLTDEGIDNIVRDFFGEVDSFYDFRLVIRRCIRKAQEK